MKGNNVLISLLIAILLISNAALAVDAATQTSEASLQTTFTVNPLVITPGSEGYIQMTVTNSGGSTANNIQISSSYWDDEIKRTGSWNVNLGSLAAGGSASVPFKFSVPSKTSTGLYTVNFYIDFHDNSSLRSIKQKAILTVQAPTALELTSVEPSFLNAGETTALVIGLENKGRDPITDIKLSWQFPENLILPLGSDNYVTIPSIDSGQKIDLPLDIVVSSAISPGVYPLTIEMEYYDQAGIKQEIASQSGIVVDSVTDFDVVIQDSSEASTTLAIANIGKNTAYSTIVKIPNQENFRVSGSSAATIGNLDAGDYTLATFQLASTTDSNSKGRSLTVEISYTDDFGERRTVQKEVDLGSTAIRGVIGERTMPQQGQTSGIGSNGLLYIGVGIAGIIGVVLVLRMLRRGGKSEKH